MIIVWASWVLFSSFFGCWWNCIWKFYILKSNMAMSAFYVFFSESLGYNAHFDEEWRSFPALIGNYCYRCTGRLHFDFWKCWSVFEKKCFFSCGRCYFTTETLLHSLPEVSWARVNQVNMNLQSSLEIDDFIKKKIIACYFFDRLYGVLFFSLCWKRAW